MSVLLVDGDNLLTIGFFGVKNYFYKGERYTTNTRKTDEKEFDLTKKKNLTVDNEEEFNNT
jgi:hypothetical protein